MHWWNGGWHLGGMMLIWPLFIALSIGTVWLIARASGELRAQRRETPEEILKRRYANGEVGREEYARRLEDLRR